MSEYRNYPSRWDAMEPEYSTHMLAMTAEDLHSKADIARELAYRDKQIAVLKMTLDRVLWAIDEACCEEMMESSIHTMGAVTMARAALASLSPASEAETGGQGNG
jgi:hypothetical protein